MSGAYTGVWVYIQRRAKRFVALKPFPILSHYVLDCVLCEFFVTHQHEVECSCGVKGKWFRPITTFWTIPRKSFRKPPFAAVVAVILLSAHLETDFYFIFFNSYFQKTSTKHQPDWMVNVSEQQFASFLRNSQYDLGLDLCIVDSHHQHCVTSVTQILKYLRWCDFVLFLSDNCV